MAVTAGVIKISGCSDRSAAMEIVAANEFPSIYLLERDGKIISFHVVLSGEAEFIGSVGEGDTIDFVLSHYGRDVAPTENDLWEYSKSAIAEAPGIFMKAWLHWNGAKKEFDAYLKCAQDHQGASGVASHEMPYIHDEGL